MPDDTRKSPSASVQDDSNLMSDLNDSAIFADVGQSDDSANQTSGRGKQGFASMSPQKQKQIASKGGKAAHEQGTAHEWTSEEARAAGRKGGQSRSKAAG